MAQVVSGLRLMGPLWLLIDMSYLLNHECYVSLANIEGSQVASLYC